MSESKAHTEAEMKGWLSKWTNYLRGYQRRWFVLSDGLLSYYRNKAEMSHTCRGTICLNGATIDIADSCTFVISNGSTQSFHLRAANEVERQRWVTALELAKSKCYKNVESDEEDDAYESGQKCEVSLIMKEITACLEQMETCSQLISKRDSALQRALSELDLIDPGQALSGKMKAINEKATLLRITSNAMMNTAKEYVKLAESFSKKYEKMLQQERTKKEKLEEIVEQLARQHSILEQAAKDHRRTKPSTSPSDEEEDSTEFYECEDDVSCTSDASNFVLKIPSCQRRMSSPLNTNKCNDNQGETSGSSSDVEDGGEVEVVVMPEVNSKDTKKACSITPPTVVARAGRRRTRVPPKPNYPLNLWSIMKNCIGKELTRIPMPVNFSEPLSMLQRLTEDYEYACVLDYASKLTDSCEQLAYVAAFTVSSYATTSNRTGKPFNPLLGETYECDRMDDLGWRAISEQVSHHPPMVALHCEGKNWKCWQEFTMTSKFRGKYLQLIPLGTAHLIFDSGNHYTWRKVTTTVHNIIVGKLWVDQHGDMDIINHKDGSKCRLTYIPYSYFNREAQRKVKGCVMDKDGKVNWVINGNWDSKIEIAPVVSVEGTPDNPIYKTGPYTVAWERRLPPPDCEKYYNFTELACQLNEPEEGVAPTDSRNRPDQRLMEEGKWDEANTIKVQLEEKQRAARKEREASEIGSGKIVPYEPVWFNKEVEPVTGNLIHIYKDEYWDCKSNQDWSKCPNIF